MPKDQPAEAQTRHLQEGEQTQGAEMPSGLPCTLPCRSCNPNTQALGDTKKVFQPKLCPFICRACVMITDENFDAFLCTGGEVAR